MIFWLEFPMGWTIIFSDFSKKSCHYVLWGKWTFFENWISNGVDDLFFSFKKNVIIYYGENALFLRMEFPMGWRTFFLEIFPGRSCRHIQSGTICVFVSTGFLMGWFMVLWTSNYIFYWCPRWYFRLKKNTFLDIGWFCLFLYLNVIWVIKNGLLKNDV